MTSFHSRPTLRHGHLVTFLVRSGYEGVLDGLAIDLGSIVNVVNGLLLGGIRILNRRETANEGIDGVHT